MSTYTFNWNWINSPSETKRSSDAVKRSTSVVFDFKQAQEGAINASSLNAFAGSCNQSIQRIRNEWNTYVYPVLASLPAGKLDTRWSTSLGNGLQKEIDCFTYGVQGATLFVFNDATSTKADGRYWDATRFRPKTIAEVLEELYQSIANLSTFSNTDSSVATFDDVWAAIGNNYRDESSYLTNHGSLDTRASTLESYMAQLALDLYDKSSYTTIGGFGSALTYSFADVLNAIMQLHNSAWGQDPSGMSHSDISVAAHTHTFDEIKPPPSVSLTSGRTASHLTLEDEVKRLRYEIQIAKGSSSWYSDPSNPTGVSGTASIQNHIAKIGSGTASDANPHALDYTDIGVDTYLNAIVAYTGMTAIDDDAPNYSSTNHITQGASLCQALGEVDAALVTIASSTVIRISYGPYDRSAMSATDRAQTPISITHNRGKKPIVQVIDNSPESSDYYGLYSSPTYDVEINYPSDNMLEVYTEAAIVEIIAIF